MYAAGLLVFAVVNGLLMVPGTTVIRVATIVACLYALLSPDARPVIAVMMWLVWPPIFLVAWALGRERNEPPGDAHTDLAPTRARVTITAIIVAVTIASLAYRVVLGAGLQQTAALFVAVPALLAIAVVFLVSPRSATGVACKAVTVGMLVSVVALGEGFLCVAMSAPLFYLIAVLVGLGIDRARRRFEEGAFTTFTCIAALVFVPLSLEGVTDATSLNRDEWVTETRLVNVAPADVAQALLEQPRFGRALPPYLRAGFPRPVSTRIENGRRWIVRMRGGETRLNGTEPTTGDLVLQLVESRPGIARWRALSDDSHMTHFLRWREATVRWRAVDEHRTEVTWSLRYRRGLDPAWYFGPWERYAARLAAQYLIDAVATP
jgi:hypothetical protein